MWEYLYTETSLIERSVLSGLLLLHDQNILILGILMIMFFTVLHIYPRTVSSSGAGMVYSV
jgi:hypothetical protein